MFLPYAPQPGYTQRGKNIAARHTETNMQKLSSLLFPALISISIIALAHETRAQTSAGPSKAGTRLITLGTSGGPNPRAHQAQSSNLLIVNGVLYVIDAADGVARRLAKAGINS